MCIFACVFARENMLMDVCVCKYKYMSWQTSVDEPFPFQSSLRDDA